MGLVHVFSLSTLLLVVLVACSTFAPVLADPKSTGLIAHRSKSASSLEEDAPAISMRRLLRSKSKKSKKIRKFTAAVAEEEAADVLEKPSEEEGEGEKEKGEETSSTTSEAVTAAKQEDSGNSGVAEEMALADKAVGAGKEEAGGAEVVLAVEGGGEGEGGNVEEVRVVSDKEAMQIEAEVHADEENYVSFMTELMGITDKINPTLQAVKDKTAKHVVPTLANIAKSSHEAFAHTSKTLYRHITPYVGSTLSPILSTLLSYSLLLLPLLLIVFVVNKLRVIFTVQKLLLLTNLYLTLYCFALLVACLLINAEPMRSLRVAAESNYFLLQILQCFGYICYVMLQFLSLCLTAKRKEKEQYALLTGTFQCCVAIAIGLHYYVTVFERAMLDRSPHTSGVAYFIYFLGFATLTVLTRTKRKDGKET